MKTVKVLKPNSFCLELHTRVLGIADGGTFASAAWVESDELLNTVISKKLSWIAPNGEYFTDHRDNFRRPTEDEIRELLTSELEAEALKRGIIEIEIT